LADLAHGARDAILAGSVRELLNISSPVGR
jgi:hypothetical protein